MNNLIFLQDQRTEGSVEGVSRFTELLSPAFVGSATFCSGIKWHIGFLHSSKVKLLSHPLNGGLGQRGGHLLRGFHGVLYEMQFLGAGAAWFLAGHPGGGGEGSGKAACKFKYH